jgi:hypothetical protein
MLAQFPNEANSGVTSWRQLYRSLIAWHWDEKLYANARCRVGKLRLMGTHKRKIEHSLAQVSTLFSAEQRNIAVFGNQLLRGGVHYWEVTVLKPKQHSPGNNYIVAIGVATSSLAVDENFAEINWGVGYYNDGQVVGRVDGRALFPQIFPGSKIGVHADFEKESLTYYLNGTRLQPSFALAWPLIAGKVTPEEAAAICLRPAVLLRNQKIKLKYYGPHPPSHSH